MWKIRIIVLTFTHQFVTLFLKFLFRFGETLASSNFDSCLIRPARYTPMSWLCFLNWNLIFPCRCHDVAISHCRESFIEELEDSRSFFKSQNRLLKLLFALYNLLAANSEVACYFIIVLNNMVTASVISLILPILVFLWAMLSVPRPTKRFWMTAIVYTEVRAACDIWLSCCPSDRFCFYLKILVMKSDLCGLTIKCHLVPSTVTLSLVFSLCFTHLKTSQSSLK